MHISGIKLNRSDLLKRGRVFHKSYITVSGPKLQELVLVFLLAKLNLSTCRKFFEDKGLDNNWKVLIGSEYHFLASNGETARFERNVS
jgi:hypothetical protein